MIDTMHYGKISKVRTIMTVSWFTEDILKAISDRVHESLRIQSE